LQQWALRRETGPSRQPDTASNGGRIVFIGHFTEQPWQDEKSGLMGQVSIDLEVSNRLYDSQVGANLYNRYLDEEGLRRRDWL
jgi:hypothetical protein